MMVERIARIARVKGVDYDVGRRFDSRQKEDEETAGFANTLRRVMNKSKDETPSKISDAYKLELSSIGTQSLLYFGGSNLNELLG